MEMPENDRKRPPDGFVGRRREADVTPDTVLPRAQQDVALRTKDGARVRVLATVFGPALPPCWSDECVASWVPSSPCPSGSCLAALVLLSRLVVSLFLRKVHPHGCRDRRAVHTVQRACTHLDKTAGAGVLAGPPHWLAATSRSIDPRRFTRFRNQHNVDTFVASAAPDGFHRRHRHAASDV